jgi:Ni,Fe-hydrogenase III large subunit
LELNELEIGPMSQTITIDPVTRLEGHGKITIQLNGKGEVEDAHFHITQVRGFERFSQGRPFYEMPGLMARICGICPVSHLLASANACDCTNCARFRMRRNCAVGAVACVELLPSLIARSAAGHGLRPG